MVEYGIRLANAAEEVGAKPVYFLTWAYENARKWMSDNPEALTKFEKMQQHLNDSYFRLAVDTDGVVCPIGIAWSIIREKHPEIKLHREDGSHPSKMGAYLSALVMYATLFDEEPEDMPETLYPYLTSKDRDRWGTEIKVTSEQRQLFESAARDAIRIATEIMNMAETNRSID